MGLLNDMIGGAIAGIGMETGAKVQEAAARFCYNVARRALKETTSHQLKSWETLTENERASWSACVADEVEKNSKRRR